MAYDINSALERLERNLQDIESARKQVEETVATSQSLQKVVSNYVTTLESLNSSVNEWIVSMNKEHSIQSKQLEDSLVKVKDTSNYIIEQFTTEIGKTVSGFNEKVQPILTKVGEENAKLSSSVKDLNALQGSLKDAIEKIHNVENKIDAISRNLDKSQQDQDGVLVSIKGILENIPQKVKENLNDQYSTLCAAVSEVKGIAEEIKTGEISIDNKLTDILNRCNVLSSDLDKVKKDVQSANEVLGKQIGIKIWILIVGLILLLVLHFL